VPLLPLPLLCRVLPHSLQQSSSPISLSLSLYLSLSLSLSPSVSQSRCTVSLIFFVVIWPVKLSYLCRGVCRFIIKGCNLGMYRVGRVGFELSVNSNPLGRSSADGNVALSGRSHSDSLVFGRRVLDLNDGAELFRVESGKMKILAHWERLHQYMGSMIKWRVRGFVAS